MKTRFTKIYPDRLLVSIIVLFAAFSFFNIPKARAVVPTFDVGLNPLLTTTQATIIANQGIQIEELAAIASGEAGQYQKEVGIPPPLLLPYLDPTIAKSAITCNNLDCFAWIVAKTVVHNLSQQIITWIRTGNWDDGPLFVTDWEKYLLDMADQAGAIFLQELNLTNLCEPFAQRIKINIGTTRTLGGTPFNQRASCKISDVLNNVQNFYNDFSQGGWARWFEITQIPQNNVYGSYYLAHEEKLLREGAAVEEAKNEALSANGLLGQKECEPATVNIPADGDDPGGDVNFEKCRIVTPGKAVEEELAKVLGTNIDQLNLADEMDEILIAILQTLLQKIINGTQGLLSEALTDSPAQVPPPINIPTGGPIPTAVATPTPTPPPFPVPTISGTWLNSGNQSQPTSIIQTGSSLTFINEVGGSSGGTFTNSNTLSAPQWGITGTLNTALNRIDWSNGTFWTR